MTREEAITQAINIISYFEAHFAKSKEAREEAVNIIEALEREPILDKIREEIKTKYDSIPWRNNDYDDGWIEALEWVFEDVIDKYRQEG